MNLSDVSDSDNVMELPVGFGISGRWNSGFILDANDDHAGMHRWGVNGTVGYEF